MITSTRMYTQCTACSCLLYGGRDTFGTLDNPLCSDCFFAGMESPERIQARIDAVISQVTQAKNDVDDAEWRINDAQKDLDRAENRYDEAETELDGLKKKHPGFRFTETAK